MIRPDLSGRTAASFTAGGGTCVVEVKRGGAVCGAARVLVAMGASPTEPIGVRRDGRSAFCGCQTVGRWVKRTVIEDGELGPHLRILGPTERPPSANSAGPVPEAPRERCASSGLLSGRARHEPEG